MAPTAIRLGLLGIWAAGALLSNGVMTATSAPAGKPLPKLVVFMVVDGFPQEQFVKYYDQYSDGGFKLFLDQGAWYGNNHYSHATTYTGVGHEPACPALTPISTGS